MSEMKVSGRVVNITEKINRAKEGNKEFYVREVWLETYKQYKDTVYTDTIGIEFVNAKCEEVDAYNVGDYVEVDVNLKGRVSRDGDRVWNTINGWRLAPATAPDYAPVFAGAGAEDLASDPVMSGAEKADDDLPF